jgi:hypothetical protein
MLINCTNNTNLISGNDIVSIRVDGNDVSEKILYSGLFDSMSYIALETSDDVLIKKITKIKLYKNKIFVCDEGMQSLFVFGMDGKFLWKINNIGRGPKEYFQLKNFDIDEKTDKIFLFSHSDKIQVYDTEGNFIEEYGIPLIGTSLAAVDNKIYFHTGGQSNFIKGKKYNYNLLILGRENILKGEIPVKNKLDRIMTFNSSGAFCKYDGEIYFFMPFSNSIYSVKDKDIHVKYQFDFGKYNLPDDYFKNHTVDDLYYESRYAYGLNSCWINGKYCGFRIRFKTEEKYVLYSKTEEKVRLGYLYDDMAYCSPPIFQATDNFILGACQAEDLFMMYNLSKEERENTVLEKIVSEITEDDNPVVFLYYFR